MVEQHSLMFNFTTIHSSTPGPWFVRFFGQEILRTNQKRTNEVRDGLGGTYVCISMNEDNAHQ